MWDFGKGWERVDWEGKGGVSYRIITIFIYNIYSIYIFTILHDEGANHWAAVVRR